MKPTEQLHMRTRLDPDIKSLDTALAEFDAISAIHRETVIRWWNGLCLDCGKSGVSGRCAECADGFARSEST